MNCMKFCVTWNSSEPGREPLNLTDDTIDMHPVNSEKRQSRHHNSWPHEVYQISNCQATHEQIARRTVLFSHFGSCGVGENVANEPKNSDECWDTIDSPGACRVVVCYNTVGVIGDQNCVVNYLKFQDDEERIITYT